MADTAIVGETIEVLQTSTASSKTPFSWSAAIAGAIGGTAITFMVIALGSGIGFYLASPYGSAPSAKTLTIAGAVWLVFAHALGFGSGGYLAGRLRSHAGDLPVGDETRFRDAAQGLVAWAIGAVATAAIVAWTAMAATGGVTQLAAGTGAAMSNPQNAQGAADATGYFVDMLFRPGSIGAAPPTQPLPAETRAEATRVVARGVAQGELTEPDRTYLAQIVAQRTGLSEDEAKRRVADVETKAKEGAKDAADKAAKAGSYFSFWSFMAMLFGAAAATLGGLVGGELRDRESFGRRAYP